MEVINQQSPVKQTPSIAELPTRFD